MRIPNEAPRLAIKPPGMTVKALEEVGELDGSATRSNGTACRQSPLRTCLHGLPQSTIGCFEQPDGLMKRIWGRVCLGRRRLGRLQAQRLQEDGIDSLKLRVCQIDRQDVLKTPTEYFGVSPTPMGGNPMPSLPKVEIKLSGRPEYGSSP